MRRQNGRTHSKLRGILRRLTSDCSGEFSASGANFRSKSAKLHRNPRSAALTMIYTHAIVNPSRERVSRVFEGVKDNMIKSQLIQKLADENPHLYQRDVERIVSSVFEEITDALSQGDRVELRGFGAFSVKHRDARVGRNPRTGESVEVPQKRVPFFKTGKDLRDRMNS